MVSIVWHQAQYHTTSQPVSHDTMYNTLPEAKSILVYIFWACILREIWWPILTRTRVIKCLSQTSSLSNGVGQQCRLMKDRWRHNKLCLHRLWRSDVIQSNLGNTTTEGTGSKWSYFSGGLICQVLFKKFQNGVVHMPLREPWHQRSVIPTCKRGRKWQRPCQAELENAKIARSECLRRKVRQSKKCFSLQFDACGRFLQVKLTLWADFRCPQFAFLRWSHFQEHIPYIWIRELKGLKLCVRNFQVVAFVRWSQGQVRL